MTSELLNNLQYVYSLLDDDESKKVFRKRLLYSITYDISVFNDICNIDNSSIKFGIININNLIAKINKLEEYVIYGAGDVGNHLYNILPPLGVNISCFWDIDPIKREKMGGVKISAPSGIWSGKIIIGVRGHNEEIIYYLQELGIIREQIITLDFDVFDYNIEEHYFEDEIIKFSKQEVFIDVGAYDLDTSLRLLRKCGTVKKIYAFEPNEEIAIEGKKKLEDYEFKKVKLIPAGLWSKSDILRFKPDRGSSKISMEGCIEIKVVTLDETVDDAVTFIKMDIEGAEMEALKGAAKTICKYKPKLAISIYHKKEDFIDITLYIKKLVPEYKFFMRHYTNYYSETVLYAICENQM